MALNNGISIYTLFCKQGIKEVIHSFARKEELGSVDCLAVAVLSHGNHERVTGKDGGTISEFDIIEAFNSRNCPAMANKPKLFILNACRGGITTVFVHNYFYNICNFISISAPIISIMGFLSFFPLVEKTQSNGLTMCK